MLDAQNQEIKCFCPDFRPVRRILRNLGAERVGRKTQTDTYFRLPPDQSQAEFRRLKLRSERGRRQLIAYSDSYSAGFRDVRYRIVDGSRALGELLESTLGVSAVVRKRRERWTLGRTLFNLDTIDGIGTVFEAEVVLSNGGGADEAGEYRRLFGPWLGAPILGSNEDLVSSLQTVR